MSNMDHEALAERLERRLDKIDSKIDKYMAQSHQQKADLNWVKGYIKVSLSAMVAIVTGLITTIFRVFISGQQ